MTNLPATLSTLETQIGALTKQLAPAQETHVTEAIRSLISAGLSLPVNMDAAKAPEIYSFALGKVSATGVKKAVAKLVRGEYPLKNKAFIPLPPDFADLARGEDRVVIDDLAGLRSSKEMLEGASRQGERSNPEQLARIRELHKNFQHFHEANKDRTDRSGAHSPIDDERRARLEKILAAPERPDVRPEEIKFANEMANRIGGQAQ